MNQENYDVFISYSRKDYVDEQGNIIKDNVVSKVKSVLDANSITYWFDEDGIYSGDRFGEKIAKMIRASSVFLFLSTQNSNSSEWTSDEIATARAYKKKIIPFRFDNSAYNESVILFIAKLDYIDYSKGEQKAFTSLIRSIADYMTNSKAAEERSINAEKQRRHLQKQAELLSSINKETKSILLKEEELNIQRKKIKDAIVEIDSAEVKEKLSNALAQTNLGVFEAQERINTIKREMINTGTKCRLKNNLTNKWLLVGIAILFVLAILFCVSFLEKKKEYMNVAEEYFQVLDYFEPLAEEYPIVISNIEISNTEGQSGHLSKGSTSFIYQKIEYTPFRIGTFDIFIRIYEPDGHLSSGPSSPEGFTIKRTIKGCDDLTFSTEQLSEELGGWGYEEEGYWEVGTYHFEIWYEDKCLKETKFTIE